MDKEGNNNLNKAISTHF